MLCCTFLCSIFGQTKSRKYQKVHKRAYCCEISCSALQTKRFKSDLTGNLHDYISVALPEKSLYYGLFMVNELNSS